MVTLLFVIFDEIDEILYRLYIITLIKEMFVKEVSYVLCRKGTNKYIFPLFEMGAGPNCYSMKQNIKVN